MSKNISVIPQELNNVGKVLGDAAADFEKIRNEINLQVAVLENSWVGDDYNAYVQKIESLTKLLKNLIDRLNQGKTILEQQSSNYVETKENIVRELNKLS